MREFEVYYSPLSLIEAKFIVLRLLKDGVNLLEDYRIGLSSILNEDLLKSTPLTSSEIEKVADKLLIDKGLKDYFDRMIYATSVVLQLALVTEDKELTELASNYALKPPKACSWRTLKL